MEEIVFGLTGMVWNGGGRFWPDWNGLEWGKLILAGLEGLGIEEVGFGLTEIACYGRSQF
jgi:hypothetical protein